jgi:hypothetical protein
MSEKRLNIKFHQNPSSGSRVVPCGQTDGQDKASSCCTQFCERAHKTVFLFARAALLYVPFGIFAEHLRKLTFSLITPGSRRRPFLCTLVPSTCSHKTAQLPYDKLILNLSDTFRIWLRSETTRNLASTLAYFWHNISSWRVFIFWTECTKFLWSTSWCKIASWRYECNTGLHKTSRSLRDIFYKRH